MIELNVIINFASALYAKGGRRHLKLGVMNEMEIINQQLVDGPVTVLSYDLQDNGDSELYSEVKDFLVNRCNWVDVIPQTLHRQLHVKDRCSQKEKMPNTTLWKMEISPADAILEFEQALETYNTNYVCDSRIARGIGIAISGNLYAALKRE